MSEEDLEWEPGKFFVKGAPEKSKTIQEIVFASRSNRAAVESPACGPLPVTTVPMTITDAVNTNNPRANRSVSNAN